MARIVEVKESETEQLDYPKYGKGIVSGRIYIKLMAGRYWHDCATGSTTTSKNIKLLPVGTRITIEV